MTKKTKPLYDLDKNLKFLKKTKKGEYAEVENSSLDHVRAHVDAQYIQTDEKEYYHSFVS